MEKPEACDSCHFETADLLDYPYLDVARRDERKWLCALCAGSETGRLLEYERTRYTEHAQIMQTICHVGNAIIAAIRAADTTNEGSP